MKPSVLVCRCEQFAPRGEPSGRTQSLPRETKGEAKGSEAICSPACVDYRKSSHFNRLKGQSLVEFAILLPVLLLVSLMIIDLGRAVYYYSVIHNAAREAVRYGVINPDKYVVMEQIATDYAFGLGVDDLLVKAEPGPDQGILDPVTGYIIDNPTVRVSIEYTFNPATPLVKNFLPGGKITLESEAVMRVETYPKSSP
jgi:hypothetical protein